MNGPSFRRLTDSGTPLHLAARSNWEDLGQVNVKVFLKVIDF